MIPFTVGSVSAPVTAIAAANPRREAAEGHFDRGPPSGLATSRRTAWESGGRRHRIDRHRDGPVRHGRVIFDEGQRCAGFPVLARWLLPPSLRRPGNSNPHARCKQRRLGSALTSHRTGVGGRSASLRWIYRAESVGEGDRSGRYRGAPFAGAHPQARVAVDQVGEPGADPLNPARHPAAVWALMTAAVVRPVQRAFRRGLGRRRRRRLPGRIVIGRSHRPG